MKSFSLQKRRLASAFLMLMALGLQAPVFSQSPLTIHLETGRQVSMNGTERFPMASSFKVPIAVQLLTRIDKGEVKLDQMIEIKQSDLHPGSGTLSDLFNKGGLAVSVRNLMELMLLISDNSATDVLLRTAGGAEAVTARMRALGLEACDVSCCVCLRQARGAKGSGEKIRRRSARHVDARGDGGAAGKNLPEGLAEARERGPFVRYNAPVQDGRGKAQRAATAGHKYRAQDRDHRRYYKRCRYHYASGQRRARCNCRVR